MSAVAEPSLGSDELLRELRRESEDWQLYVAPHFNGHFPDQVYLHPSRFLVPMIVRPWSDDQAVELASQARKTVQTQLRHLGQTGRFQFLQVAAKLQELHDAAETRLGTRGFKQPFAVGLYLPAAVREETSIQVCDAFWETLETIQAQLQPEGRKSSRSLLRYFVISRFNVERPKTFKTVAPAFVKKRDHTYPQLDDYLTKRIRTILDKPDVELRQDQPLPLNKQQKRLSSTRGKGGRRHITGPAGSGKSLVLAARAAHLCVENKRVLVLTFNKTLTHYLEALFLRHLGTLGGASHDRHRVTFLHFHGYMRRVAYSDLCGIQLWRAIFGRRIQSVREFFVNDALNVDLLPSPSFVGEDTEVDDLGPMTLQAVELVTRLLRSNPPNYDAILIDEGQDWSRDWWPVVESSLAKRGEIVLVEDAAQDLYERAESWADKGGISPRTELGLTEDSHRLEVSYRLHPETVSMLENYAARFLDGLVELPRLSPASEYSRSILARHVCVFSAPESFESAVAWAVDEYHQWLESVLPTPDIFLVSPTNFKEGAPIVELIEESVGLKVLHTFTGERDSFYETDHRIKGSTPHSIKGWESRGVVAAFRSLDTRGYRIGLYIAMSRLLYHPEGSLLAVVTTDRNFVDFAKSQGFECRTFSQPKNASRPSRRRSPGRA